MGPDTYSPKRQWHLSKMLIGHGTCAIDLTVMGIMIVVGSAAKAYLFLLRLRAVYGNSRVVKLLVGMGWLAVVGARMTLPFMIGTAVRPTSLVQCLY